MRAAERAMLDAVREAVEAIVEVRVRDEENQVRCTLKSSQARKNMHFGVGRKRPLVSRILSGTRRNSYVKILNKKSMIHELLSNCNVQVYDRRASPVKSTIMSLGTIILSIQYPPMIQASYCWRSRLATEPTGGHPP